MRIAWPWLCIGAALTAWGLFTSRQPTDEQQDKTDPIPSPAALSGIPQLTGSADQFRREMADRGRSYEDFDDLRSLGETLPKQDLLRLLRSAPEESSAHDVLSYLLAERDPQTILDHALTIDWQDDYDTHKLAAFAIANWAKSDPAAAEAWLTNTFGNPKKLEKGPGVSLRSELLGSLSQHYPARALDWIRRYKIRRLGGMVADRFAFPTTAHWRELMEIDPTNDYWAEFFQASDASGYAEWLEEIDDQIAFSSHQSIVQNHIAHSLNEAPDPKAEADRLWANSSDHSSSFGSSILKELLTFAPRDAEQWLRDAAPEVRGDLDSLKGTLVREISEQDPTTAFAWLITIENKKTQIRIGDRVFNHWSRYQPETAEREFLAAGFTPEWVAERRKERMY
jgi:hypothetical protein